jgi:glycosyltransferase involved in cell wall biosynthesis
VAVVTVSYNTRELTAFLLWSLRRIVSWQALEIVVVDNGSRDGSAELLADAEHGGVCVLLANNVNRQHGPGLNQGVSWLASRPGQLPAWMTRLPERPWRQCAGTPEPIRSCRRLVRSRSPTGVPRWPDVIGR